MILKPMTKVLSFLKFNSPKEWTMFTFPGPEARKWTGLLLAGKQKALNFM